MKSTELRIGNLINYQKGHSIFEGKVTCITRYKVTLDESASFKLLTGEKDNLLPIPLTEEWLLRFGAIKLNNADESINGEIYWRLNGITFWENYHKHYIPVGEKFDDDLGSIVIEFDKVHELQNIFALTGEELITKQ